ncbi:MAG: hypothetical protein HQL30_12055, partial [Candidatus Omnitrophica bacterium]|nr:hypothetical protein [Candidatus Omnitrophota bacterium]
FARNIALANGMEIRARNAVSEDSRGAEFTITIALSPRADIKEDERPAAGGYKPANALEDRHEREAAEYGGKLAQLMRLAEVVMRRGSARVASFRGIGMSGSWKIFTGSGKTKYEGDAVQKKNASLVAIGDAIAKHYNNVSEWIFDELKDARSEAAALKKLKPLEKVLRTKDISVIFRKGFLKEMKGHGPNMTRDGVKGYLDRYLEALANELELPRELTETIDAETLALGELIRTNGEENVSSGIYVGRSSGRREDSFRDNLAGRLVSKKSKPEDIRSVCRLILRSALAEAWAGDKLTAA